MRLWWGLFVLVLQLLGSRNPSLSALGADLPNGSNPGFDVHEISRSLFSYRDDPLAEVDRWSALSDNARKEWTASHQVIRRKAGIRDVLRVAGDLTDNGIRVHLEVQIIAPDKVVSYSDKTRIEAYAKAMRPKHHGTTLDFKISVAPQSTYKRVAMLLPSQNSDVLREYLEQIASTMGSSNVMFIILKTNEPKRKRKEEGMTPFLGTGKVAWAFFSLDGTGLNVADLLRATETAAERGFHPIPLYFPISVVQDLRVELIAYTPGRDHKAQWLEDFAWDQLEASLRGMAVHGQRLRFSSLQVNAECSLCERAFNGFQNPPRNFLKKAASVLNEDSLVAKTSQWSSTEKTLRIYVVDTYMLRQVKALERLESVPLSVFPGMAIITLRSSNKSSVAALQTLLGQAFLGSAYGIGNADIYLSRNSGAHQGHTEDEVSGVVFDILSRNLIRSVTEQRVAEVSDIVRGIVYFDVDPAKALGEGEYSQFWERLNLLLYKLVEAQKLGGVSSDVQAGLYLAFSTHHDMRSLRVYFDIEEHSKSIEKFRDPTLRCHFSRLKREALRASRILESRHPSGRQTVIAVGSLSFVTMVWWMYLEVSLRFVRTPTMLTEIFLVFTLLSPTLVEPIWHSLCASISEYHMFVWGCFISQVIGYFLGCLPYFFMDVLKPRTTSTYKIQSTKYPNKPRLLSSSKDLLISFVAVVLPMLTVGGVVLPHLGITRDGPFPTWYQILIQIAYFFLVEDYFNYWIHRWLHLPWLYRHVHSVHHRYDAPFSIVAAYAHPFEIVALAIPTFLGPLAIRPHLYTLMLWQVFRNFEAIDIHSGYEFPYSLKNVIPVYAGAAHHDYHHYIHSGNFASVFTWCDHLYGTNLGYQAFQAKSGKKTLDTRKIR